MQLIQLPEYINWRTAMQQQQRYQGYYPAQCLSRLADATVGIKGELQATFYFSQVVDQCHLIHGTADVTVCLVCQRCNEIFDKKLSISYCVTPVASDNQAKGLLSAYEPVLVESDCSINAIQLVEDELLLGLPLVAIHPSDGCLPELKPYLNSPLELTPQTHAVNRYAPFQVLSTLSAKQT
ncbi:MAG: YceD family protein [Candidatus Symbiodolus clandestinus]